MSVEPKWVSYSLVITYRDTVTGDEGKALIGPMNGTVTEPVRPRVRVHEHGGGEQRGEHRDRLRSGALLSGRPGDERPNQLREFGHPSLLRSRGSRGLFAEAGAGRNRDDVIVGRDFISL